MIDKEETLNLNFKQETIKEKKKLIKSDIISIIIIIFLLIIICSLYISLQECQNNLSLYKNEEKNKDTNIKSNINIKNDKNNKKEKKAKKAIKTLDKNDSHNFLVLLPGKNCPNPNLKTIYLKRKYANDTEKYLFEKDIKISQFKYYDQTFFTETKIEFREVKLKELGLKLIEKMDVHNLYILPYSVLRKLRNNIAKTIVNKYQKINRYFNSFEYVSKSSLYDNYKKMNEIFPDDYNYMLETFSFPEDKKIINEKFKNYKYNNNPKDNNVWLIKPKLGSLGLDMSILKNFTNIKKECLITKYLINPHLINGYKYDLRIHGLVTSVKPLKIYLYDEGLVRVASEKYDPKNIDNEFSYLTNLYINRRNKKKFIYPQNLKNIEDSNLWNLAAFKRYCKRNNINYDKLYDEFGDIFIKMVFSVRKKIIDNIKANNLSSSNFYHLIGIDIIYDENMKPYLLEANRRCSLRSDNDAEKYYTHNLIADTINLIGIRIMNKENKTLIGDKKYKDNLEEMLEDNLCELDRPRGEFKLIFPLKNNIEKYKKFYLKDIPKEDLLLWNNLKE